MKKNTRRIFCVHYDRCLTETIQANRKGFDCSGCQDYKPVQRDPALWLAEAQNCADLIISALVEKN